MGDAEERNAGLLTRSQKGKNIIEEDGENDMIREDQRDNVGIRTVNKLAYYSTSRYRSTTTRKQKKSPDHRSRRDIARRQHVNKRNRPTIVADARIVLSDDFIRGRQQARRGVPLP
ncbi:hypothetical protein IMY05_016G0063700 [Salix suchowensis]|nr:hypothetical protein IMY05_016G0063700 [Salix suchowensis]